MYSDKKYQIKKRFQDEDDNRDKNKIGRHFVELCWMQEQIHDQRYEIIGLNGLMLERNVENIRKSQMKNEN